MGWRSHIIVLDDIFDFTPKMGCASATAGAGDDVHIQKQEYAEKTYSNEMFVPQEIGNVNLH